MRFKIKKQNMVVIGVIVVIAIVLVVLFSGESGEKETRDIPQGNIPKVTGGESATSEEQKYAEFEAELTCELLGATDAEGVVSTMQKTISLMEEYSYDDKEYNRLKAKYGDDESFKALIVSEMKKRCPELVDQVNP